MLPLEAIGVLGFLYIFLVYATLKANHAKESRPVQERPIETMPETKSAVL